MRKWFPGVVICLLWACAPVAGAVNDAVNVSVAARAGNGYKRERNPDGSFQAEYYAIANGGRVYGTTTDVTVDRVTYPEVAEIAMRLLAGQNYHFARNINEAKLLIVLQWGKTVTYNRGNYENRLESTASAFANWQAAIRSAGEVGGGGGGRGGQGGEAIPDATQGSLELAAAAAMEDIYRSEMLQVTMENQMRDDINLPNARLLGFVDEINRASYLPTHTGARRYDDLIAEIEETRYYIIVSAYDFQELHKNRKKKLQWVTRISVRGRGNEFDDSAAAMLKSAAKYFGQNKGQLIRAKEPKGTVKLGETKFLGEAKEPEASATKASESK